MLRTGSNIMPKTAPKHKSPPPDSLPPKSVALPGDLRREDQRSVPPDSLPEAGEDTEGDEARGGHRLAPDGGDQNHPIHDDDPSEDFTPRDYEEQIDEVADSRRNQSKRADVEER
jgi:hypothetical protein